jgi:predicted DNA-binding transcriptional regulator YafY
MSRSLPDPQLVYGLRALLESSHVGRENAISLKDAAAAFHVHTRRITEAVAFLCASGVAIGAVAGVGYWIVRTDDERRAALRPERARLESIKRRVAGLDRALYEAIQRALDLGERTA